MKQLTGEIYQNRQIGQNYYELTFQFPITGDTIKPGQFVTLRIDESTVPLLRRPFAFSGFDQKKQCGSIIYQKRGRGTAILAGKSKGEHLDVIGPLGNYLHHSAAQGIPMLVAGGIGFGPIYFFSKSLTSQDIRHHFIFGARSVHFIPDLPDFKNMKANICTDDGSAGFKGTALDYLKTLDKDFLKQMVLYCCGPLPLLTACHALALELDIECFVVMEQIMACGVGACMGCTVPLADQKKYARVWMEGPVFRSKDLIWT